MAKAVSEAAEIAVDNHRHSLLIRDLKEQLAAATGVEHLTIFRVHQGARRGNDDAFDPSVVSIGPFHRGKKELRAMEEHKIRYLRDFLSRCRAMSIDILVEEIEKLEGRARGCYSEDIDINSDEFVKMMLLDGCFLLEYFLRFIDGRQAPFNRTTTQDSTSALRDSRHHLLTEVGWSSGNLSADLILLENQLPFFIIEKLFEIHMRSLYLRNDVEDGINEDEVNDMQDHQNNYAMTTDFLLSIARLLTRRELLQPPPERPAEIFHLLHLCHHYYVPVPEVTVPHDLVPPLLTSLGLGNAYKKLLQGDLEDPDTMFIPCASELQDAGINFKKKAHYRHILDVTFQRGVLEVPQILVSDDAKSVFTNLLAFEQCMGIRFSHFSAFCLLLDSLVNTAADVAVLNRSEVFDNILSGDEETAAFINQLGHCVATDPDHYLRGLFLDINRYRRARWNRHRAVLMRDYFGSPWAFISCLAAFLLIALAAIQTYFSIVSYMLPHSG